MGLAVHPSTGSCIGLSATITVSPHLERIRRGNQGKESKWFGVFSAIGLAYRSYKAFRFSSKYPECPHRVLNRVVTHGQEEFGGFELCETTEAAPQLLGEVKLLVSCAWNTLKGNSVRYEFGYRWFHQTLYDSRFRSSYLEILEIAPVQFIGSTFLEECLRADPEGKSNSFDLFPGPTEDRSIPIEESEDYEDDVTVVSEGEVSQPEAGHVPIESGLSTDEASGMSERLMACILSPLMQKVDCISGLTEETISIDGDELSILFDTVVQQLGDMDNTDPRVKAQVKGLWCYTEGAMSQLAYKYGYVFPDLTFAEDWKRTTRMW